MKIYSNRTVRLDDNELKQLFSEIKIDGENINDFKNSLYLDPFSIASICYDNEEKLKGINQRKALELAKENKFNAYYMDSFAKFRRIIYESHKEFKIDKWKFDSIKSGKYLGENILENEKEMGE